MDVSGHRYEGYLAGGGCACVRESRTGSASQSPGGITDPNGFTKRMPRLLFAAVDFMHYDPVQDSHYGGKDVAQVKGVQSPVLSSMRE